jgi:hypothetical protein
VLLSHAASQSRAVVYQSYRTAIFSFQNEYEFTPMAKVAIPENALDWQNYCTLGSPDDKAYWIRWTSLSGLYYWLHPASLTWIGEPHQTSMPNFESYKLAVTALYKAPAPPIE